MNKRRRRKTDVAEGADANKRKVPRTQLEDLATEVLYEIFDYCDYCSIHDAFASLNSRFQSLFDRSSSPLKINFPLTSKSVYQHRCERLIKPNAARIISLNITRHFLAFFSMDLFTSLQSLTVRQIRSKSVETLLSALTSLPCLSALSIESPDYFNDENLIYLALFRLTKIKFCKLTFQRGGERVPLSLAVDPCQALERFIIDGFCRLDQLATILSYLPRLQHLSCGQLYGTPFLENADLSLGLTSVDLNIIHMSFNDLGAFLSNVGRRLKVLRIQTPRNECVVGERWEQLIKRSMPCLQTFDLRYTVLTDIDSQHRLMEPFSTKFWMDRKWLFDWYYQYDEEDRYYFHFFSIVPFKHHQFTLYEHIQGTEPSSYEQNHPNYARHVTIEGCLKAKKYTIQFPRARQLTLNDYDVSERPWCTLNQTSIVPLPQIQELHILDSKLSGKKLAAFLRDLPTLQSLTVKELPSWRSKWWECLASASSTSRITKVTILESCPIACVKQVLRIFPQVEQLELNVDESQLKEVLRVLLSEATHLFSLVLSQVHHDVEERVQNIIESERLVSNYSMERIHGELYLWW